ncbi:MAG: hypothetical protein HYY13_06660 [Nitrospirae bacterium]|nr:hypothetical protein [Nitrospirota bacterium]
MATPRRELIEMLQAYKALERILARDVDPRELYRSDFVRGLNTALREVRKGSTRKVRSFEEFVR